jgi:hypothetical protein
MSSTLLLNNDKFVELSNDETLCCQGGGILLSIAVGVITGVVLYYAAEIADEACKRKTGSSIGDHITNGIGKALNTVGEGIEQVGNFIAGY